MAAIKIDRRTEIMVVYFTERRLLNRQLVVQVGRELGAVVSQTIDKKLLLNFRSVSYLATMMLSELIALNKACQAENVDLKLCEIPPNIMEVFRITKLHKLFAIHATEDAALKSFGSKRFFGWLDRSE